jgi:hypothetical protein
MDALYMDPVIAFGLSIVVLAGLTAPLVLAAITFRQPKTSPMAAAAIVLVCATVVAAVSPVSVLAYVAVPIALLGVALAVVGGNPATRVVLRLAAGSRVRETADGGILIAPPRPSASTDGLEPLLRGGTAIGYLERLAVVLTVMAGFPEAIAVVVAIKGIGRFSELAAAEARERFIVGTFASLVWAATAGALVRLAIW